MSLIICIKKIIKNSFVFRLYRGLGFFFKAYVGSLNKNNFGYIDNTVHLAPPLTFSNPRNVYLMGHNTLENAIIFSTNARFIMEPWSGAAEGLRVSTGNHPKLLGRFFITIRENEKPNGFDADVIIESDVWIGRNVVLLPGVRIGRGATVGAGAVVRKSIPPYAIAVGNPAKVVGFNFNPEEVIEHERNLYPEKDRLPLDFLEMNYNKYFISRIKDIKEYTKL